MFPLSAQPAATQADPAPRPLTLDDAIGAAESANIDVLTARLAVKTAQANLRAADTSPNPVLTLNATQVRPSRIGSRPYGQIADSVARVDVPLERGGKRQARTGAARAMVTAAQDDLGDARRQMRAAVIGAYFDLKAAESRVDILQAVARSYADSEKLAAQQQRAGAISDGDFARQRVEAVRARTDADQAVSDWREAQLALATLIGREPDAPALATAGDWPGPALTMPETPESIAMRRPDVRATQARLEAARRNLDGAHALRHPDVTVGAQYERADADLGVGNSVGVGLSVPLPLFNRYKGEVDAAAVALTQAEADARKALAAATAEITLARRAEQESASRRKTFDEIELPAAQKAADVAEFAYAHGATSLLDLLDARRSLRAVQLGAIDAHSDETHAIARLQAAETTGDE